MATAELELLLRARDDASRQLEAFDRRVEQNARSIDRVLKPALIAATVATTALVAAGTVFGRAAMEQEVSVARLQQAIKNTGNAFSNDMQGKVTRVVDSLKYMSGFTDNELMDSLSMLVAQTGSADEAMTRLGVAVDFARGTGMDLATASRLMGKVTDETTNVLARYGIHVEKGTSATALFALIQQKFAGQGAAYGKTVAGQWAIIGNRIDDVREKLGDALLPILSIVAKRLGDMIIELDKNGTIKNFAEMISAFGSVLLEVADRVGEFFATIKTKGLDKALTDLIHDVVIAAAKKLPEIGAALDALGPVGWIVKIAAASVALSVVSGIFGGIFGGLLGFMQTAGGLISWTAGPAATPLAGSIGLGISLLVMAAALTPQGQALAGDWADELVVALAGFAAIQGFRLTRAVGLKTPVSLAVGAGIALGLAVVKFRGEDAEPPSMRSLADAILPSLLAAGITIAAVAAGAATGPAILLGISAGVLFSLTGITFDWSQLSPDNLGRLKDELLAKLGLGPAVSPSGPSGPAVGDNRIANSADIVDLYRKFLGRDPENTGAIIGRVGRRFQDVANELRNSAEGVAYYNARNGGGGTPGLNEPGGPIGPPVSIQSVNEWSTRLGVMSPTHEGQQQVIASDSYGNEVTLPNTGQGMSVEQMLDNYLSSIGMATGGVVRKRPGGSLRILGEGDHDEAVVPLDGSGVGGVTVHVEVHGSVIGIDSVVEEVTRAVRDAMIGGGFRGVLAGVR